MKHLNKTLQRVGIIVLSIVITVMLSPTGVAAAGGPSDGPYGPHDPEDTFGSTSFLTVAAVITYTVGLAVLAYVKLIKNKIISITGTKV